MSASNRMGLISGNILKIIAAVCMVIDHVGLLFFPELSILRIIGRIAFPVFAYMIAEGCKYTKNKLKYFSTIFILGIMCQVVYWIAENSLYMCILITFSLSILVIYAMQYMKKMLLSATSSIWLKAFSCIIFALTVYGVYILNRIFVIDYGFWGCLVPVFAALFQFPSINESSLLKKMDCKYVNVLTMGVGLCILSAVTGGIQIYSLCSIPLLMLYSEKRGKYRMKYMFYIFYPLHLALLQGIAMLMV